MIKADSFASRHDGAGIGIIRCFIAAVCINGPVLASGPSFASAVPSVPTASDDLVQVIRSVDRSLFQIEGDGWTGSGFRFGSPGMVVTNRHVVEAIGLDGMVTMRPIVETESRAIDLGAPVDGVVRYIHRDLDLAVIEMMNKDGSSAGIRAADTKDLLPRGSSILIHGFPGQMTPTVSLGIVAGHHREVSEDISYYVLDAASGSGGSGGPVTDRDGRLVGVMTAVYDAPEDLGFAWAFAIPSRHVQSMFDEDGNPISSEPQVTVEDLLQKVRQAGTPRDRVLEIQSGLRAIRVSSSSLRDASDMVFDFMSRSARYIDIRTRSDTRLLMDIIGAETEAQTAAGFKWGLLGDEALSDPGFMGELEEREVAMEKIFNDVVQRSRMKIETPADQIEMSLGIYDSMTDQIVRYTSLLPEAVDIITSIIEEDIVEMRRVGRDRMGDAMAVLGMIDHLLGMSGEMLPSAGVENQMPRKARQILRDFRSAVAAAERAIDEVPAAVLAYLFEEDLNGDDIRQYLANEGLRKRGLDTEGVVEAGDRLTISVSPPPGTSPIWGFLAESTIGADIDLYLYDPTGTLMVSDEAMDAVPLVTVSSPISGNWTLEIRNHASVAVTVGIEEWRGG